MNNPAEAIHDRIWAKAIAFSRGNRKYMIITLDILGLPSNVNSDLIKRVSGDGWNIDNIMLLPSHSHGSLEMAALNSKNVLNSPQIGIFQPELLEFLLDKLEALVKEVDCNYQPVKIAAKAFDLYNAIKPGKIKDFKYSYITITLPEQTAHPSFMKTGGEEYGLNENTVKIVMKMLGPSEVGLGAIRIGDLLISGVPGEMTAELGMQVKRSLKRGGIKYVAIGGLANEWVSYILSRNQYINGEGYESSVSFYGPDLGSIISNEIIKTAIPLTK